MENNLNKNIRATEQSAKEETVDLKALVIKILKKWYWFVLAVFICGVVTMLYVIITPAKYSTQTTIIIREDDSSGIFSQLSLIDGLSGFGGFGGGTSKKLEDEIQVMTSKTLLSQMVRSLDIQTEYFEKKGIKKYRETYLQTPIKLVTPPLFKDTVTKSISFIVKKTKKGYEIEYEVGKINDKVSVENLSAPINTPLGIIRFEELSPLDSKVKYKIVSHSLQRQAEFYAKEIEVNTVNKKTSALNISLTSTNREKAKDILNTFVDIYNQEVLSDKNIVSTHTATYIAKQIDLTKQELADLEVEVERYKKDHNITDVSVEARVALEAVSEYEKSLIEIETQINIISFIDELVKDKNNQYSLIPASLGGIREESLLLLINSYNEELLKRTQLLRSTNLQNPVINQIESRLNSLRSNIILSIANVIESLNLAKANLLGKDTELASRMSEVPTIERQFREIKRMQEVKQTMYLFLLQKEYENALTMEATMPPVRILDAAYSSLRPVAPRTMMLLLIAIVIGVIIPLIVILLWNFANNKIGSEKEFINAIDPAYLGKINTNKSANPLIVKKGTTNRDIELFKTLRTNVLFNLDNKKSPVILVTSSTQGEGKSYISINLAASLTLLNKKVVMVELNLSNPVLADYLGIRKNNIGLSKYLSDESVQLNDIISTLPENTDLALIQAGAVSTEATELLYSDRLDKMITELKKSYDYIIIDSAPVYDTPATYLLNRTVDDTVYVAKLNYTSKDMVSFANSLYQNNRLNNMMMVLNGTKDEKFWI